MARFKWHTLDKRERDPGWADERPENDGPVIDPASPFRARRGRARAVMSLGPSWLISRGTASTEQPTKSKRSKKKFRSQKSGATTPFDTASLSVHRGAEKADERKKRRAKKKAAARARGKELPQTPGEKARARRKGLRRARQSATSGRGAARDAVPAQPIVGAPHGQMSPPEGLIVRIPRMTVQQASVSWVTHERVATWKVICSDSSGDVVRRTRVASRQTSVVLGGLRAAKRPLSFLVRGYSSDGQLVCEGSVGGKSSETAAESPAQHD